MVLTSNTGKYNESFQNKYTKETKMYSKKVL